MSRSSVSRRPQLRLGAVIAIAVAAGLVAWLVLRGNGSSSSKPPQVGSSSSKPAQVGSSSSKPAQVAGATATTQAKLADLAAAAQHPIFWLGPKRGFTYELTQSGSGKVYVRYLPRGVAVGAAKPYLTVATYPFPGAYPAIEKQAAAAGAVTARLANGGLAVLDNGYPESVHIAYPGVDYQVEVYDPTPARALRLVSSGRLTHLGRLKASPSAAPAPSAAPGASGAEPTAASVDQLNALAARLGHPIYWAGPKAGYRYELTQTSTGKVYIRYLPEGVKVGDSKAAYLTVATYPFPGAYAAVKRTENGTTTIKLARGGIGVVDTAYPKSIHLAYPGVNYQIEVYDPSPSSGRKLAASGAIAPVQ